MSYMDFIPGATVVGLIYRDGVILGAERRIAYGRFVVSKTGKKIFIVTDTVGAACAGMVADMQILVREVSAYVRIKELELKRRMAPNSVAKLMSVIMFERRFFPLLTQVILGGIDGKPNVYVLDPLGSVIPDEYAAVGSGAEIAIGVLEAGYRPGMSEAEAKELVVKSIRSAVQRDAGSGGEADLLIIDRNGMRQESNTL